MSYTIQTERLGLRLWRDSDLEEFSKINADPRVMEYFPGLMTKQETTAMMVRVNKHHIDHGYGLYATEILSTQEFIGFIGFAHPRFEASFTPCVEIGWRLKASIWNQGFCTEGALACLDYYRDTLGKNEIYSWTSILNKPSERIMQKIGMHKTGEFSHPLLDKDSRLAQHVIYKKDLSKNKKANPK